MNKYSRNNEFNPNAFFGRYNIIFKGIPLLVCGVAIIALGSGPVNPDSDVYRRFGADGVFVGSMVFGLLLLLSGVFIIFSCLKKMLKNQPEHSGPPIYYSKDNPANPKPYGFAQCASRAGVTASVAGSITGRPPKTGSLLKSGVLSLLATAILPLILFCYNGLQASDDDDTIVLLLGAVITLSVLGLILSRASLKARPKASGSNGLLVFVVSLVMLVIYSVIMLALLLLCFMALL